MQFGVAKRSFGQDVLVSALMLADAMSVSDIADTHIAPIKLDMNSYADAAAIVSGG